MTRTVKEWHKAKTVAISEELCRKLCGNRLFSSDMSLEVDRLTVAVESRDERIRELVQRVRELEGDRYDK